jgi:predicted NBD/HSP70 family sugar kinase
MRSAGLNIRSGAPAVLRRLNTTRVLDAVRQHGPLTRRDLAALTSLSKPTVNEIVEDLERAGLVRERPPGVGAGDRPGPRPRLVEFRSDSGFVVGIDVGANKVLGRLCRLDGEVVEKARVMPGLGATADQVIALLRATVSNLLQSAGIKPELVRAVAIGTPGVVDPETGAIRLAPQIAGLEGRDLRSVFVGLLACPVIIENEVHLSLLGERWTGAGVGDDNLVLVNVGIGIGAAILIEGNIYRGATGAAGEIGYLPMAPGPATTVMTTMGAFERDAGGDAYARLGRELASRPEGARVLELAGGDAAAVDAQSIFQAAALGDEPALALVELLVERLARGVAAIAAVLDPATVVIGGGLSRAGEGLMEPLRRHVAAMLPIAPTLVLTTLGDEAVVIGATVRAMSSWEDDLYSSIIQAAL